MIGLVFGVITGLVGFSAFTGWRAKLADQAAVPLADRAGQLLGVIVALARKVVVTPQQRTDAVNNALALGLPKTAQAVQVESGLPADELWPGTTTSVKDYVGVLLAQGAKPTPPNAPTQAARKVPMKPKPVTRGPAAF